MGLILKLKSNLAKTNFLLVLLVLFFSKNGNCQSALLEPLVFKDQFKISTNSILIDLRKEEFYAKGHISKSRNIVFEDQNFEKAVVDIPKDKQIFLYCQNGEISKNAAVFLSDLGFLNIIVLDGGFEKWIKTPLSYASSSPKFEPLAYYSLADIENLAQKYPLVILDFYATWCKPCKQQEPILKELNEEYPNLKIVKIDADKNQTLSSHFEIEEIPTLILFKYKKQFWRKSGLTKRKQLEALL
jgi:thioredoxin